MAQKQFEIIEIMIPLKYLNNFWGTLEMLSINCENNRMITWFGNGVLATGAATNQVATFTVTDTKLYVPVVTLSTQYNA